MVNGYYTIDSHCHVYPDKIASKAVSATDRFYGVESFAAGTFSDLTTAYKRIGIDHAIIQSVATTPKQVKSINEFIADEVAASSGFLTGLGTLHPDSDNIAEDIDHLIDLGLKGVKLHPDIQNFRVDGEKLFTMYDICEKQNLTMLIHTGDYRYDNSNPNRMVNVLKSFPKLKVIGAHLGGWSVWEDAVEKLSGFQSFYVDCSSCFGFTDSKMIKEAIYTYGTDRVLFGTDYPMWSAEAELKRLLEIGFSEEDNKKILAENAKKLFNI